MIRTALSLIALIASAVNVPGGELSIFDTGWITSKPEVMTYRSKSPQGEGLYQVSLLKVDSTIQVYVNMISPGFTKSVSGTMLYNMRPLNSEAKIVVDGQITMETRCSYDVNRLHVNTVIRPYNRTVSANPTFDGPTFDFSQLPILTRVLRLELGGHYAFSSLNPQTNTIVPLSVKVVGEDRVAGVHCLKVAVNDFEGLSIYWVEQGSNHRVLRIEQPESHRETELLPQ